MAGSDDNDDFDAYLDSLPDKIRAELSHTVQEQAQMLSDAQRQALEGQEETEPTGDLTESCMVTPGRDELSFVVSAGGDLTTKEVRDGSGVGFDYALAFEFGTTRQHAKPFFWNTYHAKRDQIVSAIDSAVEKVLK